MFLWPLRPNSRWIGRRLAFTLLLAAVVRGGMLVAAYDNLESDPDAYLAIARGLNDFGLFGAAYPSPSGPTSAFGPTSAPAPTAFRPPLYPWLLACLPEQLGTPTPASVAVLHWLLGLLTVAGTYAVTRSMVNHVISDAAAGIRPSLRENIAMAAAVMVAIDPLLLQSSSLVMTETLAACLVVAVLRCWSHLIRLLRSSQESARPVSLAAGQLGLMLGLAYLCRPTFAVWPVLLSARLAFAVVRQHGKFTKHALIGMLSVFSVFVLGWTARNAWQLGKPVWATTHGGYTLLLGNNPVFYRYLNASGWRGERWDATFFLDRWQKRGLADPRAEAFWGDAFTPDAAAKSRLVIDELADDRLAYETAIATIQRQPSDFLQACLWRIWRLHSPIPLQTGDRTSIETSLVACYYLFVGSLLLIAAWKLRRKLIGPEWTAVWALWVAITAVHTFYWTDMRMRAPAVPAIAVLAACALLPRQRLDEPIQGCLPDR